MIPLPQSLQETNRLRALRTYPVLNTPTEREKSEIAALRLASIVEFSDDAIIGKDFNSMVTSWNKGAENIFGYSAEEMVGMSIMRLIPADRQDEENQVPIFNGGGKCTHFVAFERDITEKKRAEVQIAEQAQLLDKAHDAILVRDLQGKILFWNKGAERLYGWTCQEAIGRNVGRLLYAKQKKFDTINGLTIREGEWHGELHHRTKDGKEITIEARWTLIRDNEGHPKSVLAINTDVTEKKKIEAQFMHAQRMESVGMLAGGIAHDLNNILTPIMLSIEILNATIEDPEAKSILEIIEASAKRGADIVRQVLSFARGLEGERIEVQPNHLLKELESIIKDTFPKDIRCSSQFPTIRGQFWWIRRRCIRFS
jgi:PAS domain S-box-containing protein